jgi:WD40 repeat protein
MPLRLDIKRRLTARSDRVKSCDLHPTEQWMLVSLYNGNVHIWNYESQQLVKSFEVCELPVRAAVFVPRKNWVITGSDDMQVLIYFVLYIALLLKRKMLFGGVPIIDDDLKLQYSDFRTNNRVSSNCLCRPPAPDPFSGCTLILFLV